MDFRQQNKQALYRFLAILSGFMLVLSLFVIVSQRNTLLDTSTMHVEHEARMISSLLVEALGKGDYATVELFIQSWARQRPDIASINLVTENGFELAAYERGGKVSSAVTVTQQIVYGDQHRATLSLNADFADVYKRIQQLTAELLLLSVIFIVLLGALLWRSLLNNAVKPLQREVEHRAQAERELMGYANQLEIMRDQAVYASTVKSRFLANMSHELRTPLNSIIGFTDIIRLGLAGPVNDEQAKQLGMVASSSNHLLALINDILDISKIESGKVELSDETFPLRELLSEAVAQIQAQADEKELELSVQVADDLQLIHSDRQKLYQILVNLLSNAVKFTPAGGVKLQARRDGGQLTIAVSDSGIGISEEEQDRIFDAFHQVDASDTRAQQGTGLGLSIVRGFAELLKGELTLESAPGEGSTFMFSMPCTFVQADENPPWSETAQKGAVKAKNSGGVLPANSPQRPRS